MKIASLVTRENLQRKKMSSRTIKVSWTRRQRKNWSVPRKPFPTFSWGIVDFYCNIIIISGAQFCVGETENRQRPRYLATRNTEVASSFESLHLCLGFVSLSFSYSPLLDIFCPLLPISHWRLWHDRAHRNWYTSLHFSRTELSICNFLLIKNEN